MDKFKFYFVTRLWFLLGILSVAASPASAQNNLIPEFSAEGMVKTLRETTSKGSDITVTQTSQVVINNGTYEATIEQDFQGTQATLEFFITVDDDGVYDGGNTLTATENGITSVTTRSPLTLLREFERVPEFGQTTSSTGTYELSIESNGQVVQSSDITIEQQVTFLAGFVSVTVPAGTFDNAIRAEVVETITTTPTGPFPAQQTTSTQTSTQWLVNGVGLVKQESTHSSSVEAGYTSETVLLSYNAPDGVPTGQPDLANGGTAIALLSSAPTPAPKDQLEAVFDQNGVFDAGNGFCFSPWLGFFYGETNPWIYHFTLGWLYLNPSSSESSGEIYLYDPILGWLFTNEADYPSIYSFDRQEWLYYNEDSNPRVIVVAATRQPI